jgi:phosphopantetheinyl transferase
MMQVWAGDAFQIYISTVAEDLQLDSNLLSVEELFYCQKSPIKALQRSRIALRLMVKEIFQSPSIEVLRGMYGRPIISDDWDITFSHKNDLALVGRTVAPSRIGADIEAYDSQVHWPSFYGPFFNNVDQNTISILSILSGWNHNLACVCLFSLKESFFKALDRSFVPTDVEITYLKTENAILHFNLNTKYELPTKNYELLSMVYSENIISICIFK